MDNIGYNLPPLEEDSELDPAAAAETGVSFAGGPRCTLMVSFGSKVVVVEEANGELFNDTIGLIVFIFPELRKSTGARVATGATSLEDLMKSKSEDGLDDATEE